MYNEENIPNDLTLIKDVIDGQQWIGRRVNVYIESLNTPLHICFNDGVVAHCIRAHGGGCRLIVLGSDMQRAGAYGYPFNTYVHEIGSARLEVSSSLPKKKPFRRTNQKMTNKNMTFNKDFMPSPHHVRKIQRKKEAKSIELLRFNIHTKLMKMDLRSVDIDISDNMLSEDSLLTVVNELKSKGWDVTLTSSKIKISIPDNIA